MPLNHTDLNAVKYGGLIREDVMDKIWDISNFPLPFTDIIAKGTHSNRRVEWVTDELAAPVTNNVAIEGQDVTQNNASVGERRGNFTQIALKAVRVTDTLEAVNSIGNQGSLAYQVKERQKELRRDVEAQMLSNQASAAGNSDDAAGISASLGAQIATNVSVGATGAAGGFDEDTGVFDAATPGNARALSEKLIRDMLQGVYESGGNTSVMMARPPVVRKLSEYLLTEDARVATLQSNKPQGGDRGPMTAYGSVNVFITDFGQTIEIRDNRLQPVTASGVSTVYLLDPSHIRQSILRGYQVEPLAKTGLSDRRMMSVQYSLVVTNEKSQGAIFAVDETAAVIAGS